MVRSDGIRSSKGLSGDYVSDSYGIAVQFAIRQVSRAVRGEPSDERESRRPAGVAREPIESKRIIPIQFRIVYSGAALGLQGGGKHQTKTHHEQCTHFTHFSSLICWGFGL
jgi:hypothetical protein